MSFRWKRTSGAGATFAPLEKRDEAVVLEIPGRGDDDVPRRVRLAVVARERTAADRGDDLGRADHGPAERMVAEHRLVDQVVGEHAGLIMRAGDLLNDHAPLAL